MIRSFITRAALAGSLVFTAHAADPNYWSWAKTPPMGWNSWDCFGAGVWQTDVLANADYLATNLKPHGWNLITIDIQWYEPLAHTTEYRNGAILEMDANGRLLPAPNRFPMTAKTHSFKPIADYLHARGLKFGLHLMRGIPRQAVAEKTPIKFLPSRTLLSPRQAGNAVPIGRINYTAADIADKVNVCRWNTDMYGVDMTKPGAQAYYDSVFAQMAAWGLDFVKVDDLSRPYHAAEIEAIRKAIDKCGRPIVLSTSPGATPLSDGEHVETHASMWRISDDFWDSWGALYAQFARVDNWTPFRGPGHWPDADMIPFGNVRAWTANGWTHFTHDEHYTLMTLWCIGRSPLILGGNLPKNDDFTLSLLTNDEVIAVNQNSVNNHQLFNTNNQVAWVADVPGTEDKYLAVFNTSPPPGRGRRSAAPVVEMVDNSAGATNNPAATPPTKEPVSISVSLADLGISGLAKVRDLWARKDLGNFTGEFAPVIDSHGAGLYRVSPVP